MEIKKVLIVFSTVLITLFTAILLNYAAKNSNLSSFYGAGIVLLVIAINFIKFKTWGVIYKHYHLNDSYPLIALFFPLVYTVAIFNKEASFEWTKIIGILFIVIGTIIINKEAGIS